MNEQTQFDFLEQFIETTLDEAGFNTLTEETRAQYVPQFVAEAERRIGLALIPKLTETSAKELDELLKNDEMTAEEMRKFWVKSIPNFETTVQETLKNFAVELKDMLAHIAK